jgi:D-alanyl-D-alanine carboxypeptidase/D-alanyl-D-alanine-endopeptidase (penicillin-binding protein 4)
MKTVLASVLILSVATAQSASWTGEAKKIFTKEIKAIGAPEEGFSFWVSHKDEVADFNGDKLLVPASLSKIPTALTFLENKSMGDKFYTWVYHTGKIKEGVLVGDLYLKGGGDPSFVTESMWRMVNQLKRSDIQKIKGQVYVDESYFDSDYYSEGRQERRVDRAYDAPVSALSFNWNSISIYVRPGKKPGDKARVYTSPDLPKIQVNNRATTTSGKTSLAVKRNLKDGKIVLDVDGKISTATVEEAFYKSIGDAALWTGETFKKLLNTVGISYTGDIKKAIVPSQAKQLIEFESWSMPRLLAALSKFSNNFVAEMLTKHLGKKGKEPGNIEDGLEAIRFYLRKQGWKDEEFSFVNPSGFTRENQFKASRLGELLVRARDDFQSAPEFMASLPISGTDGTLRSRMKQTMRGKVRAKTGYLSGVVALAGYMEPRRGGEPVTFVLLYNGPSKHDWKVRAMFNRILWRLYQKI